MATYPIPASKEDLMRALERIAILEIDVSRLRALRSEDTKIIRELQSKLSKEPEGNK